MVTRGRASKEDPPDTAARVDVLYQSDRTRVTRLYLPGGTLIRKEPLGPDAPERLRHEVGVLKRLAGVPGVAQLARSPGNDRSILLEDVHGIALADRRTPLDPDALTTVALGLARAVAGMHHRGVLHRDISPANIVLGDGRDDPCLIDFTLATAFAEIRPEFAHHNEIVGTMPYLAPEQTGRTGRPVDQRADLYAMGATLYELATGDPPFGDGDLLQLSRDHLTRVPQPPVRRNPAVSPVLSQIIMHLLEKEPDNRYQTADGLAYDLTRVREAAGPARVGEHDYPMRLLPPSRLVGRDSEIEQLTAAFGAAVSGRCRGVLISGAPGVGKTSLINELRPIVTASNGWFVTGTFDQYRRDQEFDGVRQAFRGLGRMLLAEPEEQLAEVRQRLLRALGPNAGLAAAVVPELAVLLRAAPDPGDALTAQVRAQRVAVQLLRAIASPERPVVFVVDDLQWAARTPLGLVDAVFSGEEEIDGLLLVGAYREGAVDAAHPLAAMLSRWRQTAGPVRLRLHDLPTTSLAEMLTEMLRLRRSDAVALAATIEPYTKGNPYDTIELLNALRRDGVLTSDEKGWHWDFAALHRMGRADTGELLLARAQAMPRATRMPLETMACLGHRVEVDLLAVATGLTTTEVLSRLEPALEAGWLITEPVAGDAVRFGHERVREALLNRLGSRQSALRLRLARRLAAHDDLFAAAAEQYLPVVDAVRDPRERQAVVGLLLRAAKQAKVLSNYAVVERYLASAVTLIDPADTATMTDALTRLHAALYSLGRLDEADEVYRSVDRLSTDLAQRTDAVLVQVCSLTNRNRPREAVSLGIDLLRQLGCAVPTPELLDADINRRLDALYRWIDQTGEADDLRRPEVTDPTSLATGALMTRLMAAAFFSDPSTLAWLTLESVRMWAEYGPCRTLVAPMSHVAFVTIALRQDYRTGHRAMRRILAVAQERGYEPDVSEARFLYAVSTGHWFEPLPDNVALARRARDGLLQGGDLQKTSHTYFVTLPQLLDSAPTLDSFAAEVSAGLAFAGRTGNDESAVAFRAYQRLERVLRGQTVETPEESAYLDGWAGNTNTAGHVYTARAIEAVLLHDPAELSRDVAGLTALLPAIPAIYLTATAHLLRALDLAGAVRAAPANRREAILSELDAVVDWLAGRAADAPMNFLHLLRLAEAERAWAAGDFQAAARAFDAARRESAVRQRPWHRALVSERAARFYLAYGLEAAGQDLLGEARQGYHDWGATAKVSRLDWAYPTVEVAPAEYCGAQPIDPSARRASVMTAAIDLPGILAASQALSSETSIDGLRERLVEVLGAMTGASGVQLLLWSDDDHGWLLSVAGAETGATIPLAEAGRRHLMPLSVVRYAERTREPLVVGDASRDDRFARDPYFAGLECCSLLVVPIFNRGELRALLLLENNLIRGAFSAERLDGVMLIAGQLAVSLDNAMVYTSLEQKVAGRTEELALANERLEQLSITDSLTGLANRRRFDTVLDAEWQRARRLREPIGLAIADIDHFKRYNDHYGHTVGDTCLRHVAAELSRNIRDVDLVARYGGEEFAIVMPGTDIRAGHEAAERLRGAVIALGEPHALVDTGLVTVSVGVASMVPPPHTPPLHAPPFHVPPPHPPPSQVMPSHVAPLHVRPLRAGPASLVELADTELYRAKRAGRNRVRP